jgi:ATP-binding cassette subfamily B protein
VAPISARQGDMNKFLLPASGDKYYGMAVVVRRLVSDEGVKYWKKYAAAFVLMAITAGCTALVPYFFGQIINQAQVNRSMPGVIFGAAAVFLLFFGKGISSYGQAVILARIANRIIVSNQRKVFLKLLRENLSFYADRHSAEFITRVNSGADAIARVLNLIITSIGRDLLSLIGLAIVMVVQDPVMSLTALIVAPPAWLVLRKLLKRIRSIARAKFHGGTAAL